MERLVKQASGDTLLKVKRTEQQKQQRKEKEDEKAREKFKQQAIDEANKLGIPFSEVDVAAEVEQRMMKREVCDILLVLRRPANLHRMTGNVDVKDMLSRRLVKVYQQAISPRKPFPRLSLELSRPLSSHIHPQSMKKSLL